MKCLFSSLIFPTVSALEAKHFRGGGKTFAAERFAGCLAIPFRHFSSIRHWVKLVVSWKKKISRIPTFEEILSTSQWFHEKARNKRTACDMENIQNYNNLKHLNIFSGFPKRRKKLEAFVAAGCVISCETPTHRLFLVISLQASHSIRTKSRPKNPSVSWTATISRLDLRLDHRPTRRAPTTVSASRARSSWADCHQTSMKVSWVHDSSSGLFEAPIAFWVFQHPAKACFP